MAATVGVTTTVYVGNYFEWAVSAGEMTRYYYAGAQRIAMREGSGDPKWLLGDHLGSTSVVAKNGGAEKGRQGYKAWGKVFTKCPQWHFSPNNQDHASHPSTTWENTAFYRKTG